MKKDGDFLYDITVVMLTYNHKTSIERAIRSVIAQKFDVSVEFIISDDASTDGTQEVIRSLSPLVAAKFALVIMLNVTNVGASANFVNTVKQSNGRYIAYLEGDDYWIDNTHLQRSYNCFLNNPDAVLVSSGYEYVDNNLQSIGVSHKVGSVLRLSPDTGAPYFPHLGASMWANTYLANVPADICKLFDDNFMWTFLCPLGASVFLPHIVLHYVQTGNGLWTRNTASEKARKLMDKTHLINDLYIKGIVPKPVELSGNLIQCLYWLSASGDVRVYMSYLYQYLDANFNEKSIDIPLVIRLTMRVLFRRAIRWINRR